MKTLYEEENQDGGLGETIFTNNEELDVVVIWKDNDGNSQQEEIRQLAVCAMENVNDKAVLNYYR